MFLKYPLLNFDLCVQSFLVYIFSLTTPNSSACKEYFNVFGLRVHVDAALVQFVAATLDKIILQSTIKKIYLYYKLSYFLFLFFGNFVQADCINLISIFLLKNMIFFPLTLFPGSGLVFLCQETGSFLFVFLAWSFVSLDIDYLRVE